MPGDDPIDLSQVLDRWKAESDLAESLGELEIAAIDRPERWVPLSEAEEAAGVSRSTLRSWYRSGRIPSRMAPSPHGMQRLVPLRTVLAQSERSPRRPRRTGTSEATESPEPAALPPLAEFAVRQAVERAERAEARAERLETELKAAIERAAAAETELRLLRDSGSCEP